MPIIEISIRQDRIASVQVREAIAKEVTDAMVRAIGCPRQEVTIVMRKLEVDHIAAGGELLHL